MSAHVFHEIYLHFNWHVKNSAKSLTQEVEPIVHQIITGRSRKMKGVYFHTIGGTEDHIHLAVNIEPFVTISDMVKELKGGSSHDTNSQLGQNTLYWQRRYGVVSFGKKNLPWTRAYIDKQKQHHAQSKVFDRLERITEYEDV